MMGSRTSAAGFPAAGAEVPSNDPGWGLVDRLGRLEHAPQKIRTPLEFPLKRAPLGDLLADNAKPCLHLDEFGDLRVISVFHCRTPSHQHHLQPTGPR